ncbi:NACHT, LRR and PYD domains-containing protein 3-like isoform X1 [Polypterus senegalus]|uniref:NACHT, LRR and PYD domains-containing protein 3-like isoform X1 n=1 Tax=Polypterus senegalus TaxID=55291 RepID=UPI0019646373|nr:NACHT, LRR and PYD domains-containing protein 3-like isoform X1 [Polypterus senegalus]
MEDLKDCLLRVMEELTKEELKRFINKLDAAERRHQCQHIPLGRLERTGNDIGDIAHLMVGHYGHKAINVTLDSLEEIGRKDLLKRFGDACRVPEGRQETDYKKLYKEEIKHLYKQIKEYNCLPFERVAFNSRYIKLTIINKRQQLQEKQSELEATGHDHVCLMKKHKDSKITIKHIFSDTENKEEPKTVVIQGPAGIGKTFTIHKIMLDWSSDEIFQDRFDYVFHLRCRELKISDHENLDNLISRCSTHLQDAVKEVLSKPERLLFIFDGFDELSFPSSEAMARESSAVTLLLKRKIIPEASMLITTRPTALEVLDMVVKIDHYNEIVGFLEDDIQKYFLKSFQDQEKGLRVFQIIKGNSVILSMCFVPMVCWIICLLMKENAEDGEDFLTRVSTSSQILLHFIHTLLQHHCGTSEKVDFLQNISRLAFQGIKEGKKIFTEEELWEVSISATGKESTFLNKTFFKRGPNAKAVYHFLHLSVQEFFAAMHCASQASSEETEKLLYDSLKPEHRNLLHVVRFQFGLINETSQEILKDLKMFSFNHMKVTLQSWFSTAVKWYKEKYPMASYCGKSQFLLQLMHCLYEMQDAEFVTRAMKWFHQIHLSWCNLNRIDCLVVKYCIEYSDSVQYLDVWNCNLDDEKLKILWEVLPKCQFVRLGVETLSKRTMELFCENLALKKRDQYLNLIISEKEDMLSFLLEATARVYKSSLFFSNVSNAVMEQICKSIIPKYKPTNIRLCCATGEEQVKSIVDILRNENYSPSFLRLETCSLESLENVHSILSEEQKMRNISWELMYRGVNILYEVDQEAMTSKTRVHFTDADIIKNCLQLIVRFKPTEIYLENIHDEALQTVIKALNNEDFILTCLKIHTKSSVESICCILSGDEKMRSMRWEISQSGYPGTILVHDPGSPTVREQSTCPHNINEPSSQQRIKNRCKIS